MSQDPGPFVEFAAGELIFREGEIGNVMYIIESGEVEIRRNAAIAQPVAVLGAGDFFGEMAVLEDQPRFASATAVSKVRLLRIDRAAFADVLRENVEISIRIMRKLATRLRRAEEKLSTTTPVNVGISQNESSLKQAAPIAAPSVRAEVAAENLETMPRKSAKSVAKPIEPAPSQPAPPEVKKINKAMLRHDASSTVFELVDKTEFLVGRPDPVTGIHPEIDLGPIDAAQRSISRRHAKILRIESGFVVREDVGTVNGSFVNGVRIKAGEPMALKNGDLVRFGLVELNFFAS